MTIRENITKFLLEHPVYSGSLPRVLTEDYPLIDSGILDSIGIYTLVAHLEKSFSMHIQVSDLAEKNFRDIIAIENFVKGKAGSL